MTHKHCFTWHFSLLDNTWLACPHLLLLWHITALHLTHNEITYCSFIQHFIFCLCLNKIKGLIRISHVNKFFYKGLCWKRFWKTLQIIARSCVRVRKTGKVTKVWYCRKFYNFFNILLVKKRKDELMNQIDYYFWLQVLEKLSANLKGQYFLHLWEKNWLVLEQRFKFTTTTKWTTGYFSY